MELLLVSFVALGLSLITGNLLGAAVSNSLMQMDWLNNATDSMMYTSSYGNNTLTLKTSGQLTKFALLQVTLLAI